MGSGTTAGNAGQLMTISGTIGGLTESAGYSYDNLGRLLTSNQTSNGSSAQRRFAYDRWGNRTAMWDAVSGGNQIQSLALEQSGGVPTNRIQFNLPPGTNVALASNGATATASSSYSGGGSYPASGVINGDRKGVNWGAGGGWNDDTANTYPDWVQVSFNGSKTINEIDAFTLQDNYANPSEPTEAMTFTQHGIVDFKVQYWDGVGWTAVSGGVVTGNNKVWRKFTFSSLTTDKIRVRATNALNSYSRVTEIEAYQVVTPAYDAAGNVTNDGAHTYEYDSENRIVSVDGGSTASYAYDNQNRRYKKTVGSTVTHYVWQGSQVLAEHNGTTGAVLIDYVYSGSRMIAKISNGVTQYFLSDRLSVRLSLDSSANVLGRQSHLPFGEDFGESGTQQKQHFTSYERDNESGSDYAVNRQYSQGVGRFNRVDPVLWSARPDAPQKWNRYAYANNEPLDQIDPTGLDSGPCPAWEQFCDHGASGFSFSGRLYDGPMSASCNFFTGEGCWSSPLVPPPTQRQCIVTLGARVVDDPRGRLAQARHTWIVTTDVTNGWRSPVPRYFAAFPDEHGWLKGRRSPYGPAVSSDYPLNEFLSYTFSGSCDRFNRVFNVLIDLLDSHNITWVWDGPNSNTFVFQALNRAGLTSDDAFSVAHIKSNWGAWFDWMFNLAFPGWGQSLPGI